MYNTASIFESVDKVVIIGATTTSVTLSHTGVGLLLLPISAGLVCALSLGNKVIHRIKLIIIITQAIRKNQQTIKFFIKLYRKGFKDNLINKNDYESFCIFFNEHVDQNKKSFVKGT